MKSRFFRVVQGVVFAILAPLAAANIYFNSIPSTVQSNTSYYVGANLYAPNGGELTIWKNGNWFAGGYGWGYPQAGGWTSDTGPATIEYYAEGEDWNNGPSFNWASVTVLAGANTAPTPFVLVDGKSHGATVARPTGGSVTVTVRFKATDIDSNLARIRPQVWHPDSNYFTNDNGVWTNQSGGSGEVTRTITLDRNGNWYFWTDAEDANNLFATSGAWAYGFRLSVIESTPPNAPSGLAASNITENSFTLSWTAPSGGNIVAYEVFRNGASGGTTNSTSHQLGGLTPKTIYTMTVRAQNSLGLWSPLSSPFTVQTALDPQADEDGDGLTNAQEIQMGKNPLVRDYHVGLSALGNKIPLGWPNQDANTTVPVGATVGQLEVDRNGAANYSVPLWVTPGSSGMQPQLSLNYSSQAGAGMLGYGWSLAGVSVISRGGQSIAVDNKVVGMNFTATDRFYMDGQRLIAISESTEAGTVEYRTEIDSITKIISYGTAGVGPLYFKVWTKAGLIIEFGNTADSAAEAQGRTEIMTWAVNKISDTKGNFMDFVYHENLSIDGNPSAGEHRLTRINYTGNTGANVTPYASVRFTYEARTDTFEGYVAGSKIARLVRLKKIGSYFGETLAREYALDYIERPHTGRSILTGLREKGADNREYPPLVFNYEATFNGTSAWSQPNNSKWGAPASIVNSNSTARGTGFIDLNGDGRPDFVRYRAWSNGTIAERDAWLNDPVNGWVPANGGGGSPDFRLPYFLAKDGVEDTGTRILDYNGDGLPDIFGYFRSPSNNFAFFKNTGTGFVQDVYAGLDVPPPPTTDYEDGQITSMDKPTVLDLNGDGFVDIYAKTSVRYRPYDEAHGLLDEVYHLTWINQGVDSQGNWLGWELRWGVYQVPFDLNKGARFVDVNGDGLPDQVQNWFGGGKYYQGVALNTGTSWQVVSHQNQTSPMVVSQTDLTRFLPPTQLNAPTTGNNNAPIGAEFVDLNGDGLLDLIRRNDGGNNSAQVAYLNTGNGWVLAPSEFLAPFALATNFDTTGTAILDINGDGLPDLVKAHQTLGYDVRLGTGRGWSSGVTAHNLVRQMAQSGLPNTGTDFVDINGDGMVDQIWNLNNANPKGAAFNLARDSDRLTSVVNGFGVTASLTYAPLTEPATAGNPPVYLKGTGGPVGSVNITGPLYVVKSVAHEDGLGGAYVLSYTYGGLRSHHKRGSLGFEKMTVTDGRTGIRSETINAQTWPFTGMPISSQTISGSTVLKDSMVVYDQKLLNSGKTLFVFARNSNEITRDLNGAILASTSTTIPTPATDIDDYGNIKRIVVDTNGYTKTTDSVFTNDTGNWFLGRLTSATVTTTAPSQTTQVRASSFTYDPTAGLLLSETVQPGTPTLALTTTYEYDAFGNKKKVTVSGADLAVDSNGNYTVGGTVSRITETQYDTNGRFPLWTKNALNHQENYTGYDQVHGVLTAMSGANGLPTSWQYDGFGRKIRETRADTTVSEIRYKWATAGTPAGSLYLVESESTGAVPALSFHDKYGRVIRTMGINGDGKIVHQSTAYDNYGRAHAQSNPYFNDGSPIYWSQTTSYDVLGRPLITHNPADDDAYNGTYPDGTRYVQSSFAYSGLVSTATDPKGRVARTEKNAQGWTISNTRNHGASGGTTASTVTYAYDALGNLTTTVAAGVTTSLTYDLRGRKTSMTDADMGTWHYRYNSFGELIWQKDTKSQIVTMTYDALGRLTHRIEPEGTTQWTYDTAEIKNSAGQVVGISKGKLAAVSAPGGYLETYSYDTLGRPLTTKRTIPGSPFSSTEASYFTTQTYDSVGRPDTTIYPTQFTTRNVYNQFGYLSEVRNNANNFVYWMADGYAVTGQIDGEIYGNGLTNDRGYSAATGRLRLAAIGPHIETAPPYSIQYLQYTYDAVGNVLTRSDGPTNRTESFTYDGLDRLLNHTLSGAASASVSVTYDALGNIQSKSDAGSYIYGSSRPHAVTTVSGGPLGTQNYTYDANGNMATGGGRSVTWTSFNQLLRADMSGGKFSEFAFGAGHERVKQTSQLGTTTYVGALFERFTPAGTGAITENKHYIYAPTGRIAVYTYRSDATQDTHWFHTDGLGSITAVTNGVGAIVKRFAFDAWGKRLDPATNGVITTNAATGSTASGGFTRGYTDHEQLDDLGLIHMNGRIYDPVLGRFLSADPFIDNAGDSQSYNRYSYVNNNPLRYTDPSGYLKFKDVLKIVAVVVVAVVVTVVTYGAASGVWTTMGGVMSAAAGGSGAAIGAMAAGGFASGFAGSLLNGGSIGDAFKAGVIGGLSELCPSSSAKGDRWYDGLVS